MCSYRFSVRHHFRRPFLCTSALRTACASLASFVRVGYSRHGKPVYMLNPLYTLRRYISIKISLKKGIKIGWVHAAVWTESVYMVYDIAFAESRNNHNSNNNNTHVFKMYAVSIYVCASALIELKISPQRATTSHPVLDIILFGISFSSIDDVVRDTCDECRREQNQYSFGLFSMCSSMRIASQEFPLSSEKKL